MDPKKELLNGKGGDEGRVARKAKLLLDHAGKESNVQKSELKLDRKETPLPATPSLTPVNEKTDITYRCF